MTINSELDARFIETYIGQRLREKQTVKVNTEGGAQSSIDYCVLDNGDPKTFMEVLVLLPGFGSGWGGMSMLGYELVKQEWQVIMVSMPGYGNSSDPFLPCYLTDNKKGDVEILSDFVGKVLAGRSVHFVGHSMSTEILTRLAYKHPEQIASLTLLNPAGFEKRSMIGLGIKFVLNGIMHNWAFRGNRIWKELKKYLPKEKGSLSSFSRIWQRIVEWKRLCKGQGREYFRAILPSIPIACIWGKKDFVFPMRRSSLAEMDMRKQYRAEKIELPLWHNTTMSGSELTAKTIDRFIHSLK